jgi:hypothetical protein
MAMTFDVFCERLGDLRQDRSGGLVKPYKPVLLAAVVILIHKGKQPTCKVFLDGGLRSAFKQLMAALHPRWPTQPKAEYPFRHLERDGIWELVPIAGAARKLAAAREVRAEAWDILKHVECAQLDRGVHERLAASFEDRFRVLQLLARRYFPAETSGRLFDYLAVDLPAAPVPLAADADEITERVLEEHLERHWDETPFAQNGVELARRERHGWPGRQVFTPVNAIDLLGFETKARRWWVIELKRNRSPDAVVGQVSRYLGWIAEERRGTRESAVGAIIVRHADAKLRYAVKPHEGLLSLWEFDDRLALKRVA